MSQVKRPTTDGAALAVVLIGAVLSIVGSLLIDILMVHPVDIWAHVGKSLLYVLEFALSVVSGVLLALPLLAVRPKGPLVPIVVGLIAIPVNIVSDLLNLIFENVYYRIFDHVTGLTPFSGIGQFFSHQTTLTRLSYLMAPLAAVLLAVFRVWMVGSSAPAAGPSPYGPYAQPYVPPQAPPYGPPPQQQYGPQGFRPPGETPPPPR